MRSAASSGAVRCNARRPQAPDVIRDLQRWLGDVGYGVSATVNRHSAGPGAEGLGFCMPVGEYRMIDDLQDDHPVKAVKSSC